MNFSAFHRAQHLGVVEKILALLGMATGKIFRIYSSDSPK
jgi:hypothetical protein